MPSTIKLRVVEARDLPVMDRKSGSTDAYVSISFGEHTDKTSICRKTLHPKWDHLFRVDVPEDTILQDEPVRLTVLDKDIYSSDNAIGVVILDLNCLLVAAQELKGWYPIFDTLRGVRGFLFVHVKLQFFGDVNPFKSTAAGVAFFSSSELTTSEYEIVQINGFCEELIMADDPDYHWAESFRTSRTSNESRMLLLHQLASTIRRNVGSKALEMGGNAVLAYRLQFDFEGEGGIVARGLGTACTVERRVPDMSAVERSPRLGPSTDFPDPRSPTVALSTQARTSTLPTPIPASLAYSSPAILDVDLVSLLNLQRTILKGVQLLTISYLPDRFNMTVGGVVSAHSIKLLGHKNTDREFRDKWWQEVRNEIRAHARALHCHVVLGYSETTTIVESDVCILSAIGTAVCCDLKAAPADASARSVTTGRRPIGSLSPRKHSRRRAPCSACHTTYSRDSAPFRMNLLPCSTCGHHLVPDLLLATIRPGRAHFEMVGGQQLVEARVVRSKKKCQAEANATLVSEMLPFVEFDLHRQLMYKLRLLGMNAAFGLRVRFHIGDNLVVAVATATATFLPALPAPPALRITRTTFADVQESDSQDLLIALSEENCAYHAALAEDVGQRRRQADGAYREADLWTSDDEGSEEPSAVGEDPIRQTVVLQIDDENDEDAMTSLLDPCPPDGIVFTNTDWLDGDPVADIGSLTAFRRIHCDASGVQLSHQLSSAFHDLYARLTFAVRQSRPLAIACIQPRITITDGDCIDLVVTAQVVKMDKAPDARFPSRRWPRLVQFPDAPLDWHDTSSDSQVSITALERLPGAKILSYLGRVHLHFVNERWITKDENGLARYAHQFLAEAHSVVRANVAARGGNCLISYSVGQFTIEQPRRDQVYCVITVSGDAVLVQRHKPGVS
ncbi:C2 domain-containing protein [Plasmodiophora brassicae]|uniref:C2 domain-containing protein n=1 Tax=Plasmodiophora brassicae TaxID=37360 RepID=A0A3P3YNB6_PLABS|nr:unnamed protein product [Plasmodiophora brassicae]